MLGLFLVIFGLIAAAAGGLWWMLRKGRACPRCGKYGTELEILLHLDRDHERE